MKTLRLLLRKIAAVAGLLCAVVLMRNVEE